MWDLTPGPRSSGGRGGSVDRRGGRPVRGGAYSAPPFRRRYLGALFLLGVGLIPAIPLPVGLLVLTLGWVHGPLGSIPLAFLLDTVAGFGICLVGVSMLWSLRRAPVPTMDPRTAAAAANDFAPVVALMGGLFTGVVLLMMSMAGPTLNPVLRESLVAIFGILAVATSGARVAQRTGHPWLMMLLTVAVAALWLIALGVLPLH